MSISAVTKSVTAQHAEELRKVRDRSDDDIRDDYIQPVSAARIAQDRAVATVSRRLWEEEAATRAVADVVHAYLLASGTLSYDAEEYRAKIEGEIVDLEGVTISVTISDLVASATLTPPPVDQRRSAG